MKFSIIFGSHARGDFNEKSDFDVVLVNMREEDFDLSIVPAEFVDRVDFVKFSDADFKNFHDKGSLFLYHLFNQGVLTDGSSYEWSELKNSFKVQLDFTKELKAIERTSKLIKKTSIFGDKFLTPLSNVYPELKNACIFNLADKKVYEFNKYECLKLAIPSHLYARDLHNLKLFYDYVVRGQDPLPFDPNDKQRAESLLEFATNTIEWLCNDCSARYH